MATRSLVARLTLLNKPITTRVWVQRQSFHSNSLRSNVTPATPAGSSPAQAIVTPNVPPRPQETTSEHAAYLGEADSNDGFETYRDAHGAPKPALDAQQSAFLGEADSDDAFEADKDINPERHDHKIADTTQAAYLGEADSDDAFEADKDIHPEKHDHKIEDVTSSGLHGQAGELDK